MLLDVYAGESVRLNAANLTHIDDGPVSTPNAATVTFEVYDPTGALWQTAIGTSKDPKSSDWYADVKMPPAPLGDYIVKVTALDKSDNSVWRSTDTIRVKSF